MDATEFYLPKGTLLKNRYELISIIGTGGFGITYQAVDRLLNCYVAVKEFFPQEWVARNTENFHEMVVPENEENQKIVEKCLISFRHEADILEAVKDVPYIARLKDYFKENGTEYIVKTLIQGKSLSQYAKERGGKLPAAEALSLFQYTFDTLGQLHKMGFIHRDISPGNLILSEDNVLYLIDFGAAASFREKDKLQNQQVFQHKGLEAPEYSQNSLQGPWTDIFSLCATIVYLITGEGMAEAKDRQQFDCLPQQLLHNGLSSKQQNALMKGLNPDIHLRFSTMEQLHGELYDETLAGEYPSEEYQVFYHAKTYIGSRAVNQDNFMLDTICCYKGEDCEQAGILACRPEEIHVAAVCDGVGGGSHGELASKAAVQAVIHFVEAYPERDVMPDRLLEDLLDQINEKILQLGEKIGRTATTLSLLLWHGSRYYAVNIGDSPIYILRKRKLLRLSTSHTRAELKLMMQQPVERADQNTLMQFLGKSGVAGSQMASFRYGKLQKGDTFLICSDGVSKKVEASRLKRCLSKKGAKSIPAMFKIIERSTHNDNCTAIVLKF